jgi:GNAT superfamily N-acetyltransferase
MVQSDAQEIAEIHCEALADDFLPSLGKSFLTAFYRNILSFNIGFGVVFEKDHHIAGFAIVTEDTKLFYKTLLSKHFWELTPKVLWALMKKPSLIKRLLETLFYGRRESSELDTEAELMVIVVRKDYQHQGIASRMLHFLNNELSLRGVKSYTVRTYAETTASNSFYTAKGFKRHDSYLMYNREWNVYKFDIDTNKL